MDWDRRCALVVIHGYNVEFAEAARRTAQLGFDLRVDGIAAFFSWPSRGRFLRYLEDEESVQLAEPLFFEFLNTLASIEPLQEIHILAHSMGNRLLLRTVERLAVASSSGALRAPIGQIILAAADVATPLFHQHAPFYLGLGTRRVTSYSCDKDVALRASQGLHGHQRVGLEPPVFVYDGVDSISATEIDLHALGHGYYADTEVVLYDIAQLLHSNTPPSKRIRLEPVVQAHGQYWVFKK
jgi:esterase/lipase superfamily enzyme